MDKINGSRRVLIAFLGRGDYKETAYRIDEKTYREKLAFMAIHKHFTPIDRTYIVGTKESSWNLLENLSYTPLYIPYGRKEEEFWEIFDILKNSIDVKASQVIFDFTHGFRVLPLFGAIFVRLLQYIEPTASPFHVFYGSYEPGQNETPIVDLSPFIELLDWIDAVNAFIKYGEIESLAIKVGDEHRRAYKDNAEEKPKMLGMFSNRLNSLSNILHLTYAPLLITEAREMSSIMNNEVFKKECDNLVKPMNLLLNRLIDFTDMFKKNTAWESHLSVARWYVDNNRLTQALLVLRETIISFVCEKKGYDIYDIEKREEITAQLYIESRESDKSIHKLWNRTIKLRNDAGHAFMKKKDNEATPKKIANSVIRVIEEAENVFSEEYQ